MIVKQIKNYGKMFVITLDTPSRKFLDVNVGDWVEIRKHIKDATIQPLLDGEKYD